MTDRKLRVGVIGAGHFGRYHALKLSASDRAELSGVHDADGARAAAVGAETGAEALPLDAVLAASDAVVIAAPAEAHHRVGMAALRAGLHVLMEKPVAATLAEADELAAAARAGGLVLQVGHLERFSAAYGALAGELSRPLYLEAARTAPFKPRGTDVSVVLDLMIHDLDLTLALVDGELERVDAVGAAVASPREDIADARLEFSSGAVAAITASRVSLRIERRMRIFSADAYLVLDFAARRLTRVARGAGEAFAAAPGLATQSVSWTDHDSLAAEHAAFAASVLDGAPVLVDAAAGRRALDAALRVEAAMARARDKARASGLWPNAPAQG